MKLQQLPRRGRRCLTGKGRRLAVCAATPAALANTEHCSSARDVCLFPPAVHMLPVCLPGYGGVSSSPDSCTECPVGFFSGGGLKGSSLCQPCENGSTTTGTGSASPDNCTGAAVTRSGRIQGIAYTFRFAYGGCSCPLVYSDQNEGAHNPTVVSAAVCLPGHGGVSGTPDSCTECPVSSHSGGGAKGSTSCQPCAPGFSTSQKGSTSPDNCTGEAVTCSGQHDTQPAS